MREVGEAKEFVFGLHDGALVTLGLLTGLAGASISSGIVGLVGAVHVFAGSVSLGLVTYTSSKSHATHRKAAYEFERAEIHEHPAREKERVREALAKKGLRGKALSLATQEITEEKDHWANFFVEQRFGSATHHPHSPLVSSLIILLSYGVAATLVLFPFIFLPHALYATIASTVFALGIVTYAGVQKTRFTHKNPLLSGTESALVTAIVAVISFLGGSVLASVF